MKINSNLISSIITADLNEDGFVDIVIGGTHPYTIDVLLGSEKETFELQTIFSTEQQNDDDFNNDNQQDIIVASFYNCNSEQITVSMSRTTLYLVRHGKTEWNTIGLMQGWGDSPLTEDGIRGAQAVRDALKTIPFVSAYTSPAQRALHTAQIILEHHKNIPLETDEDLRELHFGKWEGLQFKQLAIDFPDEHKNLMFHPDQYIPENSAGETYSQMLIRMERALKRIANKHKGSPVLIVSHGMSSISILKHLQGVPLKDLRINCRLPNASISTIEYDDDGQFHVTAIGQTDHLPEELR